MTAERAVVAGGLAALALAFRPAPATGQSRFWHGVRDPAYARYARELGAARDLMDRAERAENEHREVRDRLRRSALEKLSLAIAAEPDEPEARYRRADVLYEMDQFALAAADLEVVRRVSPHSDWAEEVAFRLGVIYTKLGRFAEALRAYEDHLSLAISAGARAVGYGNAAETYMNLARLDQSIEYYRMSLREDPAYVLSEWGLAVALERDDRVAEAREAVQRAIQIDPDPLGAVPGRGTGSLAQEGVFFVPDFDVHWYRALAREARGEVCPAIREWGLYLMDGGYDGPWRRQAERHRELLARNGQCERRPGATLPARPYPRRVSP